jgi:hypothetical protein
MYTAKTAKTATTKRLGAPLVIPPDYRVAAGFGLCEPPSRHQPLCCECDVSSFTSGGLGLCLTNNPGAGIPLGLIGGFLASRTQKVRFIFDNEALEVLTVGSDGQLEDSGENFAVGGRNRWNYDTFINW